jgi:EmrB/QacA subfamily drug resistance transporter
MLALLTAVAFVDFVDASIVNIALPDIRTDLGFSVTGLQWVTGGYLLTYGGFMLLGGRAADLLGRRRMLVAGIVVIGVSSLVGGLAPHPELLVASRMVQGLGAAMTLPAALSLVTTTFVGPDRAKALGVWGAVGGLASALGVFLGGVLTEGPGWRWVMYVNPIACAVLLPLVFWLIAPQRPAFRWADFDVAGALTATGGLLALVYAVIQAPEEGWGSAHTIAGFIGAAVLLTAFLILESRVPNPLLSFSIFEVPGVAVANLTQFAVFAGFISMFFFLTMYMQNVLGYSPIETGVAYLPLCFGVAISAGVSSALLPIVGARPLTVVGAVVASAGMFWLSRISVDGSFVTDLLPGTVVVSVGLGLVFVAVVAAANAGVPPAMAGLAAALMNTGRQLGGAIGLAILAAIAAARTDSALADGASVQGAMTSGFSAALIAGSAAMAIAAVIALRTTNAKSDAAMG